jgi:hypothetical protein
MAQRPEPRDVVPVAETAALRAAVIIAEERSKKPAHQRVQGKLPRLIIQDPRLAVWLICDGRAARDDRSQVYLHLTEVHLPGLNDVDAQDAAVLGAYMTAFAQALTLARYRTKIVTIPRSSRPASPAPPNNLP